jgi:predicted nucleic acid-binding protein
MSALLADTSFFVAYLNPRDEHHMLRSDVVGRLAQAVHATIAVEPQRPGRAG